MENKTFSLRQIAAWKRVAATVNPLYKRIEKIKAEIAAKEEEIKDVQNLIDTYEMPVVNQTKFTTKDLFEKVVTDTGRVDNNGRAVKTTAYQLIYPDTVIPPVEDTESLPKDFTGSTPFKALDSEETL